MSLLKPVDQRVSEVLKQLSRNRLVQRFLKNMEHHKNAQLSSVNLLYTEHYLIADCDIFKLKIIAHCNQKVGIIKKKVTLNPINWMSTSYPKIVLWNVNAFGKLTLLEEYIDADDLSSSKLISFGDVMKDSGKTLRAIKMKIRRGTNPNSRLFLN